MSSRARYAVGATIAAILVSAAELPVLGSSPRDGNARGEQPAATTPIQIAPLRARTHVVARLAMPEPGSAGLIDITVKNFSGASTVGGNPIDVLILDCFRAAGGKGLTIDDVFDKVPPPGGTEVLTDDMSTSVGPIAFTYTSFDRGESAMFTLDPDTWRNPDSTIRRMQMAGCRAEIVFDGRLRGVGVFEYNTNNGTTVADVIQVVP